MKKQKIILLLILVLVSTALQAQTEETTDETTDETTAVSHIEIYNAFSPNGDGINDVLKVKSHSGIEEFRAIIYNRWGQKIYEWTDLNGGWDGNWNGHPAKQGTYFVLVKAKGSDGREHTIKRDVNLLRGFLNDEHQ